MLRSDAPLIRFLAETHGTKTAVAWQQAPLVLLPGEGFVQYLMEHETELLSVMPDAHQLPWEEAVFDYQNGRAVLTRMMVSRLTGMEPPAELGALDRGQCWVRVCVLGRYAVEQRTASPWLSGPHDLLEPFRSDAGEWLAMEAWEQNVVLPGSNERGFPAYPDVSLIERRSPWDFRKAAHLYPNLECRSGRAFGDGHGLCNVARCKYGPPSSPVALACQSSELIMSSGVRLALLTLAYLLQCDEHLVQVTPAESKGRKDRPEGKDPKPWTRSLPHIILLDPHRVGEYREPRSEAAQNEQRSHAPPRFHQRRGHWRVLRAERYVRGGPPRRVFVRPAWVGEREWAYQGQRYRVLDPVEMPRSGEQGERDGERGAETRGSVGLGRSATPDRNEGIRRPS